MDTLGSANFDAILWELLFSLRGEIPPDNETTKSEVKYNVSLIQRIAQERFQYVYF